MQICAIIPAAGRGERMGGSVSKPFIFFHGKPIIAHTLAVFQESRLIDEIFLVVSKESVSYCEIEIVKKYQYTKVKKIIVGGKERQDSVYEGLINTNINTELIVIHDGVRPFLEERMVDNTIEKARRMGGAVVAVPINDTIKEVNSEQIINRTVDRTGLYKIQTPQVFKKDILLQAFKTAKEENFYGTDESSLVEKIGIKVGIVTGSEFNLKITTPEDLILAEIIFELKQKQKGEIYG